jgi:GNAT superfamily N-acetyltransferase
MTFRIIEESPDLLPEYEKISIAFRVESRFRIELLLNGLGGVRFIEEAVAEPYFKDYDKYESPSQWPLRWDISSWGMLAAFAGERRVGGAAVVWNTPELDMLRYSKDTACMWDLRVEPDYRNQGIGRELFNRAIDWASERKCRHFIVETQNTNVPACRFYARQGCRLGAINQFAYEEALDEIQLIWHRNI